MRLTERRKLWYIVSMKSKWQIYRERHKPYAVKVCAVCGEEYNPERGGTKTCKSCRHGVCEQCGKSFQRNHLGARFCSHECVYESRRGSGEPTALANNRGRKPRTYYKRHRSKHGCVEDREWRQAVFERDDWTCQECGQKGGRLQADHIKPFATHPELRHDLDNGRTLCVDCHKKTGTFGWHTYWAKVRANT